jgi:hypothetical protein
VASWPKPTPRRNAWGMVVAACILAVGGAPILLLGGSQPQTDLAAALIYGVAIGFAYVGARALWLIRQVPPGSELDRELDSEHSVFDNSPR